MPKRTIKLQPAERERLLKLISLGQHPASAMRRAYMLLHSDGGRTDDAIAQRLALYEAQTRPVLDWFAERGLLVRVDGLGTEEEVTQRLYAAVDAQLAAGDKA